MLQSLSGITVPNDASPSAISLRTVWTLRLVLGFIVAFGSILFFLGTSWDIQWHSLVGRDKTLIFPHDVMLIGVGLSGLASLSSILIETLWARRNSSIAQSGTNFADAFYGPLGAYVAGFASLDAAIAFPLDAYWHSLYGIDVTIWAPFHIMFITGMAVVALGAAYMFASAARLAGNAHAVGMKRLGYIGMIVAFASMLSNFTFLVFNSLNQDGSLHLGIITFNVFPALAGLLCAATFVAIVYALPWRWTATSVFLTSLLFVIIVALFVPPATDLLVKLERLSYRHYLGFALVAFEWPAAPLLAAIGIDSVVLLARRNAWSQKKVFVSLTLLSFIACVPVLPIFPLLILDLWHLGILSFALSLLLGLLAASIGAWFGQRIGTLLQNVERGA